MKYVNKFLLKNGKELNVRNPRVVDASKMLAHLKIVNGETPFLARDPEEITWSYEDEVEIINKKVNSNRSLFLCGFIDNKLVSIANCDILGNGKKRFEHRAELGVSVKKDFWKQGIGGKMMEILIGWCQVKQLDQIELMVNAKNDVAISMYESFGFEKVCRIPRAMKYKNGTYSDEFMFVKFLK